MTRILVAGATGRLGAPVTAALSNAGLDVRVLVRDAERAFGLFGKSVEIVTGNVRSPDSVRDALRGCDAVYLSLSGASFDPKDSDELIGVSRFSEAAAEGGVRWIGYLSGSGDLAAMRELRPLAIKHRCEELVSQSGIPFTVFKPSHFYESLPWFLHRNRLSIPGRQTHRYHYLACSDYCNAVLFSLRNSSCHHRSITLHGPEAMTMREALERYRDCCHPRVSIGSLPLPVARLLGRLTGKQELKTVAELFGAFAQHGDDGVPEAPCEGFPAMDTTLEQWCRQQPAQAA